MTTVLIENLKLKTIIGLLEKERKKRQKIILDVKLGSKDFIDYAEVCKFLKKSFRKQKFLKVEDALAFFEKNFKKKYKNLSYLYIKIIKKDIIRNAHVGGSLEKFFKQT